MKNAILIYVSFCLLSPLLGQNQVDSLIEAGIVYHDYGQYEKAVECYKKALEIDPNSARAHYEIAVTYQYLGDYENTLKHSNKVIELDDKYVADAYITKGSCLDCLGEPDEAVRVFEQGIARFPEHHRLFHLYYNLGVTHVDQNNYAEAEKAFINAINRNVEHTSSHFSLGILMAEQNYSVQSILSLFFFLLLEPRSARAEVAYDVLITQLSSGVEYVPPDSIIISVDTDTTKLEEYFAIAELGIAMAESKRIVEKNKGRSDDELFIETTGSIFRMLEELITEENTGLWFDLYIPFLAAIERSGHIEAYCYHISQSSNKNAAAWIADNPEKMEEFLGWLP